ncbi:hypothetical protein RF11_04239 [Thelohanellus kitauei]|uniref:Uncharacterized protein n=1 Tax=Thelohanellus kitauei TaxID=669202 RepID=A0A0C2MLJ6_THEKT|nr:hypothetical protein RF11_04239 [Thelohanellus kitauei]
MPKYLSKSLSPDKFPTSIDNENDESTSIDHIKDIQSMKSLSLDKEFSSIAALKILRMQFLDISDEEVIINDYYCALRKSFLTHGRLVWMETRYTNPESDVQKECVYINNLQTFIKYDDEIADQLSKLFGSPILIECHEDQQVTMPSPVPQRQSRFFENWHIFVHLILFVLLFSVFYQILIQKHMIDDLNSSLAECQEYD